MQNYDIIDLAGLRIDGRKSDELRNLKHRIGVIDYADGSAYLEQGLNKILTIIHGPREPKRRMNESADDQCNIVVKLINAPFSGTDRKKRAGVDRRNMEMETVVRKIFEETIMTHLYPKSEITIIVHVLEADGSTMCCLVNSITLALMSAGIAMSDMVSACSVGYVKENLCIDLNQVEQGLGGAYMPVVVKANDEEIVYMQVDNRLSLDNIEIALKKAVDGCKASRQYIEAAIRSHMSS
jgi:exosome complex component RRP41